MYLGQMHGIARYAYSLVEGVARLRPDWRLLVWERQGAFAELASRLTNVEPIGGACPPLSLREQWEWPRLVRRWRPDLVHATSIAVAPHLGVPSVVTVADLIPWHLPRRPWHRLYRLYFRHVLAPACREARRVVVHSQASAHDLTQTLGVPAPQIRIISHGVEERFQPGRPASPPYFLCVANPKPHKNVALLLDAWARYRGPEKLLLVCPSAPWLDERLTRLGSRVERRFPVPEPELPALYQGARALLFPSYFEGFGLPALEAMACGVPVVAADATSLPEVIGDTGWLFAPHDSRELLRCLEEASAGASQLAPAALARARQFTWEGSARQHVEAYEEAMR